jgi:hypothetical protein
MIVEVNDRILMSLIKQIRAIVTLLTSSSALDCFVSVAHWFIDAFKAISAPFNLSIKKSLVLNMPCEKTER